MNRVPGNITTKSFSSSKLASELNRYIQRPSVRVLGNSGG